MARLRAQGSRSNRSNLLLFQDILLLPRLDGTSLLSLLFVLAATAALPPRARLALLGSELLFAASSALRHRRHNITPSPSSSPITTATYVPLSAARTKVPQRRRGAARTARHKQAQPQPQQEQQPQQRQLPQLRQGKQHDQQEQSGRAAGQRRFTLMWVRPMWVKRWRWRPPQGHDPAADCRAEPVKGPVDTGIGSAAWQDTQAQIQAQQHPEQAGIRSAGEQPGKACGAEEMAPQATRGTQPAQAHTQTLPVGSGQGFRPLRWPAFRRWSTERRVEGGGMPMAIAPSSTDPVAAGRPGGPGGGGGRGLRWPLGGGGARVRRRTTMYDSMRLLGLQAEDAEDAVARAELLASKLLDPQEGHLSLLAGGHLVAQWFHGLAGPHQLRTDHVAQLLHYLLAPPPQQQQQQQAGMPLLLPPPRPQSPPRAADAAAGLQLAGSSNPGGGDASGPALGGMLAEVQMGAKLETDGISQRPTAGDETSHAGTTDPSQVAGLSCVPPEGAPRQPDLHDLAVRLMAMLELPAAEASDGVGDGGVAGQHGCGAVEAGPAGGDAQHLVGDTRALHGGGGHGTDVDAHGGDSTAQDAGDGVSSTSTAYGSWGVPGADHEEGEALAAALAAAAEAAAVAVDAATGDRDANAAGSWREDDAVVSKPAARGGCACEGSVSAAPETDPRVAPGPRRWLLRRLPWRPALTAQRGTSFSQNTGAAPNASDRGAEDSVGSWSSTAAGCGEGIDGSPGPRLFAASAEPLVASYRPLSFYLLTEAVAGATHVALRLLGFRLAGTTPGGTAAVYEWRPRDRQQQQGPGSEPASEASPEPEPPLVFLHGIGLGLTPYLRLLGRLVAASRGRRRVFAVQYKHVSMRLTATIPAPHEVAADVAAFLAAQGVRSVSLLAHSYGTLVASALTKLAAASPAAPAIARLTLVDPVCFAMFLPHLVRNTIYQQPVPPLPQPQPPQPAPASLPPPPAPTPPAQRPASAAQVDMTAGATSCAASASQGACEATHGVQGSTGAASNDELYVAGGESSSGDRSAAVAGGSACDGGAPAGGPGAPAPVRMGPVATATALRRTLTRNLLRGLVVAEFHCSVALRRRLDWARVNLWPSELPPHSTVLLSGRDNLVPVKEVAAILANRAALLGPAAHHPTVLLWEDLGHGGFLADADCQRGVLAAALGCTPDQVEAALEQQEREREAARRRRRGATSVSANGATSAIMSEDGPGRSTIGSQEPRSAATGDQEPASGGQLFRPRPPASPFLAVQRAFSGSTARASGSASAPGSIADAGSQGGFEARTPREASGDAQGQAAQFSDAAEPQPRAVGPPPPAAGPHVHGGMGTEGSTGELSWCGHVHSAPNHEAKPPAAPDSAQQEYIRQPRELITPPLPRPLAMVLPRLGRLPVLQLAAALSAAPRGVLRGAAGLRRRAVRSGATQPAPQAPEPQPPGPQPSPGGAGSAPGGDAAAAEALSAAPAPTCVAGQAQRHSDDGLAAAAGGVAAGVPPPRATAVDFQTDAVSERSDPESAESCSDGDDDDASGGDASGGECGSGAVGGPVKGGENGCHGDAGGIIVDERPTLTEIVGAWDAAGGADGALPCCSTARLGTRATDRQSGFNEVLLSALATPWLPTAAGMSSPLNAEAAETSSPRAQRSGPLGRLRAWSDGGAGVPLGDVAPLGPPSSCGAGCAALLGSAPASPARPLLDARRLSRSCLSLRQLAPAAAAAGAAARPSLAAPRPGVAGGSARGAGGVFGGGRAIG